MACSIFLPYAVLAKAALSRAWAQPLTWDNLTLGNVWFTFWQYSATKAAIVNTLELGIMTATVGAVLAALLAYTVNRRLIPGSQLLPFLVLAPVVIPGVVLAVGLFIAYTRPPLILYGTLWIMFAAFLTKELPIGYSQSDATFRGVHGELEEAGRILGAGRLRVLREITAPLARSGIIATWCFIFIGVIRELSASIILFGPNTKVMSVVIMDLKEEGQFGAIAVLGLFMLLMTFATVALMQRLLGRDVLGARVSRRAGRHDPRPDQALWRRRRGGGARPRRRPASWWRCSAPRAAARPRRSGWWRGSCRPRAARSAWATGCCPRRPASCRPSTGRWR